MEGLEKQYPRVTGGHSRLKVGEHLGVGWTLYGAKTLENASAAANLPRRATSWSIRRQASSGTMGMLDLNNTAPGKERPPLSNVKGWTVRPTAVQTAVP